MPSWDVHFNLQLHVDSPDIVRLVARAQALASVIRAIPIPPAAANRLDDLNIMRAVRGTTGIEGGELTEGEVEQIISAQEAPVLAPERSREEQEARNAARLMRFVVDTLGKDPNTSLTEDLICRVHKISTEGIDYPNNTPGIYRTGPVSAGDYIPPRQSEVVRSLMQEFVRWFNEDMPSHWDPIIQALVAHFYVVSIHPFGDGNGRTARGIESLLLYKGTVNARGFYSLANYYYQHRDSYVRHLDYVRFHSAGDLTPFVLFGLRALVEELEGVHQEVLVAVRTIAFHDYVREYIDQEAGLSSERGRRLLLAVLSLPESPLHMNEIRSFRIYREVSQRTFLRDVRFLYEHGLVTIEQSLVKANFALMDQFTPPFELRKVPLAPQLARRRPGRPRKVRIEHQRSHPSTT